MQRIIKRNMRMKVFMQYFTIAFIVDLQYLGLFDIINLNIMNVNKMLLE